MTRNTASTFFFCPYRCVAGDVACDGDVAGDVACAGDVAGDGDRITTTHDTYLMSAESEEGRKEWLFVIKQILYRMIGGGN